MLEQQLQKLINVSVSTTHQQIKVLCLQLLVDYMNFENKRPFGSPNRFDFEKWWEENKHKALNLKIS